MAQNDAYSVLNLLSVIPNRYQIDRKDVNVFSQLGNFVIILPLCQIVKYQILQ